MSKDRVHYDHLSRKPLVTWRDWLIGFFASGCLFATWPAWASVGPLLLVIAIVLFTWLVVRAVQQHASISRQQREGLPRTDAERAFNVASWVTLITWGGMAAIATPIPAGELIGKLSLAMLGACLLSGFAPIYVAVRAFVSKADDPYVPPWKRIIAALAMMSLALTVSLAALTLTNLKVLPMAQISERFGIVLASAVFAVALVLVSLVVGGLVFALYSATMSLLDKPVIHSRAVVVFGAGIGPPLLVVLLRLLALP